MGIEAFGIDLASRFATEHPGLRLKFKPRVKSPAPAGLFFRISGGKAGPRLKPRLTRSPCRHAPAARGCAWQERRERGCRATLAHHPRRQPHSARSVPSVLVVEQVSDRPGLVRVARRHLLLGFIRVVRRQRLPAGLPALRRRRLRADHRDLEGAAQYREHLQQGLLGLGGWQQQHLTGSTADLSPEGHR